MKDPADLSRIGKRSSARGRRDLAVSSSQPSHMPPDAPQGAIAGEPLSDLGNAQRFIGRHRDDFRFCPVLGWLAWTGSHWSLDQAEGLVSKAVHQVVRTIKEESDDERVQKWAHTSQGARHIACVPTLARPYLQVRAPSTPIHS
jgi:D5 N terminal like